MKIIWNENPLKTIVEINEQDKFSMLQYIQREEYENLLCSLDVNIKSGKLTELSEVHEKIKGWGEICNMDIDCLDISVMEDDLKGGHAGDCVCISCTCMKCLAEDSLGISTLKGLGSHEARKIMAAFEMNDGKTTIAEVLEYLEIPGVYKKTDAWKNFSQEDYDKWIPFWEEKRTSAIKWLRTYKEEHSF